jgi:hypothetical protein
VINCNFYGPLPFHVEAGNTYYAQISGLGGGPLDLTLDEVPPPVNDNFENATAISSLPFDDSLEMIAATTQDHEQTYPQGAFTPFTASAWYSIETPVAESVSVSAGSCCTTPILAVYRGTSLTDLSQIGGVSGQGQRVTFKADSGTTYYVQLADGGGFQFGESSAPLSIHVEATPPPAASFYLYPGDPSTFDTVQFIDQSYDPGQVGL